MTSNGAVATAAAPVSQHVRQRPSEPGLRAAASSPPRNVLLVTPFSIAAVGGVSTVVRMLYAEFQKAGHHVSALIPGERTRVDRVTTETDVVTYSAYLRIPFISDAPLRGFVAFCAFFPVTVYRLRRFLREQRIDVVAAQYPTAWLLYFALLRPFCRWKLVVTFHGNDAHDLDLVPRIDRAIVGWLLKKADHVVAVSKSLLTEVHDAFPGLRLEETVVPNGARVLDDAVAGDDAGLDLPAEFIITAGHLIHRKGIDLLIRAVRIAADHGVRLPLVIAGDGPERANLIQLAGELGVADLVRFVGNQSQETVLRLLKRSLFFVLASRAEGLPLVVLEAMGASVPVVATRVDGVPELIRDGANGLVVEPENPAALAAALARLSADADLRRRLGTAGRKQVLAGFTWKAAAESYVKVFEAAERRR